MMFTVDSARSVLRDARPGMSRRGAFRVLRAAAFLLAANQVLVGCAPFQNAVQAIPGLAADADLIAKAVALILPTIRTLTGLSGGAWNEANKLVAAIENTAGQIQGAVGAALPQMVQTIGAAVAGLAGTLLNVPGLPSIVSTIIGAAGALLPALEQMVGITPAPATARRFAAALPPDQARAQLQAIVAGR